MLSCQMLAGWGRGHGGFPKGSHSQATWDAVSAGVIMWRREVAEQKVSGIFIWKKAIPKSEILLVIFPQKDTLPVTENEI